MAAPIVREKIIGARSRRRSGAGSGHLRQASRLTLLESACALNRAFRKVQRRNYVIVSHGTGLEDQRVRPGRGASGALRHELFLVAIADKVEAVQAVQACLPDAEVKIHSEASPEILAEHQVSDGEMIVLPEWS